MPVAAASRTNASVDRDRGAACSRQCCGRAGASGWGCSASPREAPRGVPMDPRRGTAAPRRTSRRPRPRPTAAAGVMRATCGPTRTRSRVRTRVASSDWCASRNVVSVTARADCSRSARANPAGPSARSRSRLPAGGAAVRSIAGSLLPGETETGFSPYGRLTVTSPSQFSSFVARSRDGWLVSRCGRSSMNDVLRSPARKRGPRGRRAGTGCSSTRPGCGTRRALASRGRPPMGSHAPGTSSWRASSRSGG